MKTTAVLLAGLLGLAAAASGSIVDSQGFTLNLYSSFEFEKQLENEGNGDPNGSFDADQFDLVFNYKRDSLRLAVDLVIEHGVATEEDLGNIELSYGFAEYIHSDALKVRAGKYLTPFGLHNQLHGLKASFLSVKEPLATNKPDKLSGNGFRFFPRRQVGLAALGGTDRIEYDVIVGNGEQDETNPFEEDNNSQKSFSSRVLFKPNDFSHVGFSLYHDLISADPTDIDLFSLGIQGFFEGEHLRFRGEVIYGELDQKETRAGDVEEQGAFAELGYAIGQFIPYVQAQYLTTETVAGDDSANVYILGLYLRFKKWAVLKVENAYTKGSSDNDEFADIPGHDYNEIRASIVLGF